MRVDCIVVSSPAERSIRGLVAAYRILSDSENTIRGRLCRAETKVPHPLAGRNLAAGSTSHNEIATPQQGGARDDWTGATWSLFFYGSFSGVFVVAFLWGTS